MYARTLLAGPRSRRHLPALAVLAAATLGAATLSGCSSPTDATKANFKAAIAHVYAQPEHCNRLTVRSVGSQPGQPNDTTKLQALRYASKIALAKMDALAQVGLVKASTHTTKVAFVGPVEVHDYTVTAKGKPFYHPGAPGDPIYMCAGRYEVMSIVNFTKPTAAMGETVTQVTYKERVTGLPAWATSKPVATAFAADLSTKPVTQNAVLVLKNDGWHALSN